MKQLLDKKQQKDIKEYSKNYILKIFKPQLNNILEIRIFGSILRNEFGFIPKGKKTASGIRYWSDIDFVIIAKKEFELDYNWKHKFTTKEGYWSGYDLVGGMPYKIFLDNEQKNIDIPLGMGLVFEDMLLHNIKVEQVVIDGLCLDKKTSYELVYQNKEKDKFKKLDKILDFSSDYINNYLRNELISLYIGGSILDKEDRLENSDVDLFGIVNEDFDFKHEDKINDYFKEFKNSVYYGFEIKFRALPISSLKEGEKKGVIKYFNLELFLKKLSYFKHLGGKKFNFEKEFLKKPVDYKSIALDLIKKIRKSIKDISEGNEQFPINDFPKHVMELIRVELVIYKGIEFNQGYKKLTFLLKKEKDHIIHKAFYLRVNQTNIEREDWIKFSNQVSDYLDYLSEKLKEGY